MGKTLEQLRAEKDAANLAYEEASAKGDDKLNKIAREQDAAIRPVYRDETPRDEHGNPIKLDQYGNPERRTGQVISGAKARPVYTAPMRSPYSEPGAPPPDVDAIGTGTWPETENLWRDLADLLIALEVEKHSQQDREEIVQQIIPSLLDRMAAVVPRVDCAFSDGPMGKGAWRALVAKYQMAFNPSKGLERSIGTMRSRTAPSFLTFATEGAKWLFRRCPSGIPILQATKEHKRAPDINPGPTHDAPPRKRGRPKKVADTNVPNVE